MRSVLFVIHSFVHSFIHSFIHLRCGPPIFFSVALPISSGCRGRVGYEAGSDNKSVSKCDCLFVDFSCKIHVMQSDTRE